MRSLNLVSRVANDQLPIFLGNRLVVNLTLVRQFLVDQLVLEHHLLWAKLRRTLLLGDELVALTASQRRGEAVFTLYYLKCSGLVQYDV